MKRTDDHSLLSCHGGSRLVVSAQGVQSAARGEWAKSRLKGERHGPAAAWQTTGGPAGDLGEQGKEEDQESLGSRAVSCHSATATGATWPRLEGQVRG